MRRRWSTCVASGTAEQETANGYWLLEVEAHHSDGTRVGVYYDCFSHQAEDFVSRNRVILAAVAKVAAVVGRRGIWVGDQGLDSPTIIEGLDQLEVRYVIRQTGLNVESGNGDSEFSWIFFPFRCPPNHTCQPTLRRPRPRRVFS
jgi:hypothetical protein